MEYLWDGLLAASSIQNLLYALLGSIIGTAVGVIPGVGPVAVISLILPFTFLMPLEASLILIAAIYYGSQYGGSTTAILINTPGEISSIVTTYDGHKLALNGKAGTALIVAAVASFFAGTTAALVVGILAVPLSKLAYVLGPPEYAMLILCGIVASSTMVSTQPIRRSIMVLVIGMLLGTIGVDAISGIPRFTFDVLLLYNGLGIITISTVIFGILSILTGLTTLRSTVDVYSNNTRLLISEQDIKDMVPATIRGTSIGAVLGLLPGGGAIMSSFVAYVAERKFSKNKKKLGTGIVEGVAAPEAANNAGAQTSFIPLFALGLPENAVIALVLGVMMMHGVAPGPESMASNPKLYGTVIASMWIGNVMLLVLNLPLIWIWLKLMTVPYRYLFPAILVFALVSILSVFGDPLSILIAFIIYILGACLLMVKFDLVPIIIGFLLGPMLEDKIIKSLMISNGDPTVFLTRPISLVFLIIAVIIVSLIYYSRKKGKL